jgi:hypothetical protein
MPHIKTAIKRIRLVVAVTIVGLIVYILSSGPALYMMRHKMLSEKVAKFIYMPLGQLEDWHPYIVYIRWWYNTKAEREWMEAEERGTPTQWLQSARQDLQKRGAPSPELIRSIQSGHWAGGGYLLFSNGWASFAWHSSHESERYGGRIGNIALLRTPEGDFYVSHFHFCLGEAEFQGQNKTQPKDLSQFLEIYGTEQQWRREP